MLRMPGKKAPDPRFPAPISLPRVGSDSVLEMKMIARSALGELKELVAMTEQCAAQGAGASCQTTSQAESKSRRFGGFSSSAL